MIFKINKPLVLPKGYIQKVRRLTTECAWHSSGECHVLDCKCVVRQDEEHINCMWYANCVLPLDKELEEAILKASSLGKTVKYYNKTCKTCGRKFKTLAKTTRMCEKCSKKAELERKKAYKIRQNLK